MGEHILLVITRSYDTLMHTLSVYKDSGILVLRINKTNNTPFVFEAFLKSEAQFAPNFIVAVTRHLYKKQRTYRKVFV